MLGYRIVYAFHDLPIQQQEKAGDLIRAFENFVCTVAPNEIEISIERWEYPPLRELAEAQNYEDLLRRIDANVPQAYVVLICKSNSQFALAAKKEKSSAEWGSYKEPLAMIYQNDFDETIIWHEMLHIIGAEDCYEEFDPRIRKSTCDEESCIMAYAPSKTKTGSLPRLCEFNRDRIRKAKHLPGSVGYLMNSNRRMY